MHSILQIPEMLFDYMHQVPEGKFTRRMTKWLVGSCSSGVNLKPHVQNLSERLQTISLPHDFKQKFRSLDEFKRWKGSEKLNFFLHASLYQIFIREILSVHMHAMDIKSFFL